MSTTKKSKMILLDTEQVSPRTEAFIEYFGSRVIGQPQANAMAQMIFERSNSRLRNKKQPIAVCVAIGPSRTGKSYSGKVIAGFIHNDEDAVTVLEGADYVEKHQVLDLKGAPPTYVGGLSAKEKAELKPEDTDPRSRISTHNLRRVRLNSKSDINVVIINEFEKAHHDFYKFWMGVFDNGSAVLGDGEIVDFTNTIFILTMNLGMDEVERLEEGGIGFIDRKHKATPEEIEGIVTKAMKQLYKKEFRNRLDAVVVFKQHTREDLLGIVDTELSLIQRRKEGALEVGEAFELEVEASARKFLLDTAMADGGSVAELKRVIEKHLVTLVDRVMDNGLVDCGDKLVVFHTEGKDKLSFGLLKGEGDVAEVDRMAQRGESHSKGDAASFQRRLHAATRAHKSGDNLAAYAVTLVSDSAEKLGRAAIALQHDLKEVYELTIVNQFLQMSEAPFMVSVTVRTTPEMAALIAENNPKVQVVKKERKG
ncbi:MAG: ATP-dependent Clp protease ATP-binding subunit [Candidatus Melainabacteria bacterium]|nr:MAG: ATP-dependent Clp protease ATP-binding subunit [Candidatus Melainabacteria bacterium]